MLTFSILDRSDPAPARRRRARLVLWSCVLLTAAALAGCGASTGGSGAQAPHPVSIALDFTPNPAHAPIFLATHDGYDKRFGISLQIREPGSGPDSLKLLLGGRVDIGVLDINDLGLARERGADVVGIAALVQQPLGALIVQPSIKRPRDLQGRKVGVSGLPSDPAFLQAILSRDGASLRRVDQITIGFNAVAQMLAGTIAAVPAFWSDEGVTLRQRGLPVREFRINHYGAPNFPEVVLVVTRATLRRRRSAIVRALAAIAVGARKAVTDPRQATRVITNAAAGDSRLIRAQTLAIAPALQPPLRLNPKVLAAWARFDMATGLLPRPLAVAPAFDLSLATPALRLAAPVIAAVTHDRS
ncbi:MAG: ABC transporter substrate-binding protein [Solirubrobacteraceae bacterium]